METLSNKKGGLAPALMLMLAAPLLTEVLPGATRFSSIFVLPIEMCVWGGGALLIRYAVRRWQLGWLQMLCLAIALSIAEECLIQQTSLAPMVIRLKGITYARSFGVNYVYFLWALIYESVFVVFLPVYLVELIYPGRKHDLWISKGGMFVVIPLFLVGSLLAWFTWTQIARVKVFHLPAYHPPVAAVVVAVVAISVLIFMALKHVGKTTINPAVALKPLSPWLPGVAGAIWATVLFGIVLLGFGIKPDFPPMAAIGIGLVLILAAVYVVPRWSAHTDWNRNYRFGLIFGTMLGSMGAGQLGFMDTHGPDLYFKIITNLIAVGLMIVLGLKASKR